MFLPEGDSKMRKIFHHIALLLPLILGIILFLLALITKLNIVEPNDYIYYSCLISINLIALVFASIIKCTVSSYLNRNKNIKLATSKYVLIFLISGITVGIFTLLFVLYNVVVDILTTTKVSFEVTCLFVFLISVAYTLFGDNWIQKAFQKHKNEYYISDALRSHRNAISVLNEEHSAQQESDQISQQKYDQISQQKDDPIFQREIITFYEANLVINETFKLVQKINTTYKLDSDNESKFNDIVNQFISNLTIISEKKSPKIIGNNKQIKEIIDKYQDKFKRKS
ncbi:hypothetical protein [Lonepinella sp. BR2271]|uniref:hypothetical protein n=1 Tax=Lonepinella sp. BR2271 TaxID=3434550 RepID=UPI003F6DD41D